MKNYTENLLTESMGISKVLDYVQTAESQIAGSCRFRRHYGITSTALMSNAGL